MPKVFFVLTFILTVISYSQQSSPQLPDEVDKAIDECTASTGVDPTNIENALLKGEFTDVKNLKCFLKCMLVKMGDMTEAGELQPGNMKARIPPGLTQAQASQIVDACTKTSSTDPCDIAFDVTKCMTVEATKLMKGEN